MAARIEAFPVVDRYPSIKPHVEFVLALILLLVAAPIILVSVILVLLTSKGSPIYTQRRLGQGGRTITIYKIRTMYQDSEQETGPVWSAPGDPRVTPVGALLRWAHLDELPQLVNILRGEMSLVGPRPERPEIIAKIEHELPHYRQRLRVRPGLTGLAQVQLPPDTNVDCVRRKLLFDLYYVERMSPGLDARILLATGLYLVHVPPKLIVGIFQFPTESPSPRESMAVSKAVSAVGLTADSPIRPSCVSHLARDYSPGLPVFESTSLLVE
jgi:lipopolysaccharide/colanic/teichoic acid biosynthesis glycosyltransferase